MTVGFRLFTSATILTLSGWLGGCIHSPQMLSPNRQKPIDRTIVETPSGTYLTPLVRGLNCPTALCFDNTNGAMLVAESGIDGAEPHIFGYRTDHSYFNIYPFNRNISIAPTGFVMYGPVTGMVAYQGGIYVAHRDREGFGLITRLGYDGSHVTIAGRFPCQGDYGIGDLVVGPNGRLFFGIGTATNSGVVGIDNFDAGWLKGNPKVHDELYNYGTTNEILLRGYHFFTPNPWAGLLNPDLSVTAFGQPFGTSIQSRLRPSEKPNGAICSVRLDGGDFKVEAFGLHDPRGLVFDEYNRLYACNDGMQMRGTRPVYDDPDSLLRISNGGYYGWPDFTTDLNPVSDAKYRPPVSMTIKSGYAELSPLVDAEPSGLRLTNQNVALYARFPSLSGAGKMAMVPSSGPFKDSRGSVVVTLDGDRGPYASGGLKLIGRVGFKVVIVDLDTKQTRDFVRNTAGIPQSMLPYGTLALERPCDVKFGPDGALYILDFGRMDNDSARPRYYRGTGAIFKLDGASAPAMPTSQP